MTSSLQPLGLTSNDDDVILPRRIEFMNDTQALVVMICAFVHFSVIAIALSFGPPVYVTQKVPYTASEEFSQFRRFSFDFEDLHYFNDFLTLDLRLNQKNFMTRSLYNVSLFFFSTYSSGTRTKDKEAQPNKVITAKFKDSSAVSDPIRLISKNSLPFDRVHVAITLKFDDGVLPGEFEWTFVDSAHSLVQIFIRLILTIYAAVSISRLALSDYAPETAHFTTKMVYYFNLILLTASDPLYILSYFSSSPIFRILDTIAINLLFSFTCFISVVVLFTNTLKHREISFNWVLLRFLPFLGYFLVQSAITIYSTFVSSGDPLFISERASKYILVLKTLLLALVLFQIICGFLTFRSEAVSERPVYTVLAIMLLITLTLVEVANHKYRLLVNEGATQVFTLITCSIYIFFFNYVNWPHFGDIRKMDTASSGDSYNSGTLLDGQEDI